MTNEEFVKDRGFSEEDKLESKIGRDVLERIEGFVSPDELVSLVRHIKYELDNAYWDIVNKITKS